MTLCPLLFLLMSLFLVQPTWAATTSCSDGLADLSLEKVLDEYAGLVFGLQETPADSAGAILLRGVIEAKTNDLINIVPENRRAEIAVTIGQKILEIRNKNNGVTDAEELAEISSRKDEYNFFHIKFKATDSHFLDGAFVHPELSPDGKTLLLRQAGLDSAMHITLVSLLTGKVVLQKRMMWVGKPNDLRFLNNGKYLQLDYSMLGTEHSGSAFPWLNLQIDEIFDCATGVSVMKNKYLGRYSKRVKVMDISADGKNLLVIRDKAYEVVNASSRKVIKLKTELADDTLLIAKNEAWFDHSGLNIVTKNIFHDDATLQMVKSINIKTGIVNWFTLVREFYLSSDRQYFFGVLKGDLSDYQAAILYPHNGRPMRYFAERDLDLESAEVGANGMFYIPTLNRHFGYIYNKDESLAPLKITFPKSSESLGRAYFIESDSKLVVADGKNISVWDTQNGTLLKIEAGDVAQWIGVDSQGNLLSSRASLEQKEHGHQIHTGLQRWSREHD